MRIFVSNIPYKILSTDLRAAFELHGKVDHAYILTDRDTGESRGLGFVSMPDQEEGLLAIKAIDGVEWHGRQLFCEIARERVAR